MKKYILCGIDEAGRGPLAGPVSAAAVILPIGFPISILDDSKKLKPKERKELFYFITANSQWAHAWAWPSEIDRINIHAATLLAMKRAFDGLAIKPNKVIVDGKFCPEIPCICEALIKADAQIPEVMAASIIAKYLRDVHMERMDWLYPEYGYAQHKGYPTKAHREICRRIGPSPIQRMSFSY
jgi:ribonuclease HII